MFRFFRRYQKLFIVVGGVILMFVFTIGDSLPGILGLGGQQTAGPQRGDVAVTWEGGQLTEGELALQLQQQVWLDQFIRGVYSQGMMLAEQGGRGELPERVSPIGLVGENWSRDALEAQVVADAILRQQARSLDMVIPDSAVTDYIGELGRGELGTNEVLAIVSMINPTSSRPTMEQLFEAVREKLLAYAMQRGLSQGALSELPINRWEQWRQVNDRVVVEAAAVDPQTLLSEVPEPTEQQLQEYYEKYKERFDFPVSESAYGVELPSPTPGFGIPRQVEVQYLRANYGEFVDRYKGEVTAEQVAAYYEENKGLFIKASDSALGGVLNSDAENSDAENGDAEQGDAENTDQASEPEYQSLEEVRDDIRQRLAESRFVDEIDGLLGQVMAKLNPLFSDYFQKRLDAEDAEREPPQPGAELLDLAPLARQYSLEYEQTPPLNQLQLRETLVGKSIEPQRFRAPLFQVLFSPQVSLYEPVLSEQIGRFGDRYLVMKLSDTPARVPEFAEVRQQVLDAWKWEEASKLALARAEELAQEAEEAGISLADFFADDDAVTVTQTPSFTRYTAGDVAPYGQMPSYRLSQPDGVQYAGPEFMQTVFGLGPGKVGAALNFDHSLAYVVRVADQLETEQQLRDQFLQQANLWPGRSYFFQNSVESNRQAVISTVLESANIEWQRKGN